MKIKNYWLGFLLIPLLLLPGCSKKSGGAVMDENGNPVSPVFQIWLAGSEEEVDFFKALGGQFKIEMAVSGLEVKVINFASDALMQDMIFELSASGKGPDVVFTDSNWIFRHKDKVVPLKDNGVLTPAWFYEKYVRAAQEFLVAGNNIYGIPLAVNTLGLIYNEDHILNRLPDKNLPSKDWTGFKRDVERLTDLEKGNLLASGVAMGRGDNVTRAPEIWENIMVQNQASFFDATGTRPLFHESKGKDNQGRVYNIGNRVLDFYTSFSDTGYKHFSWNEALTGEKSKYADYEAFIEGRTSMVFGYAEDVDWIDNRLKTYHRSKKKLNERHIKVAAFPQLDTRNPRMVARVKSLAVMKSASYPNSTWKMLKLAADRSFANKYADNTDQIPARVDLLPEYMDEPDMAPYARQAKYAVANPLPLPRTDFDKGLKALFQAALNGSAVSNTQYLVAYANEISDRLKARAKILKMVQ